MVADKRELILARTFLVGQGVSDFKTKLRNDGGIKNNALPAFVQLDGDETVDLLPKASSRPTLASPSRIRMSPEFFILLNKENKANDDDLGPRLNALRIKLMAAFATDEELRDLLGTTGSIAYNGCVTDLKSGAGLNGQMRIDFIIKYFFNPL